MMACPSQKQWCFTFRSCWPRCDAFRSKLQYRHLIQLPEGAASVAGGSVIQ